VSPQSNLWDNTKEPRRGPDPNVNMASKPRGRDPGKGGPLKTLFWLVVLGAACYFGWKYGRPLYDHFRAKGDVERQANAVMSHVPKSVPNDELLRQTVAEQMSGALATHEAAQAKWYVIIGPRNQEIRVIRDDQVDATTKSFCERLIDEGRLSVDTAGKLHNAFTYPMGAVYKTVAVDGKPWCVVVGWREKE
jgi:hypothetical protein